MPLLSLLALFACRSPALEVQIPPVDTGTAVDPGPEGPFDSIVLVQVDTQPLETSLGWIKGGDIDGDGLGDVGFVATNRALGWAKGDREGGLKPQSLLPEGLLITRLEQALGTDSVDEDTVFIQDLHLVDLDVDGQVEWVVTATAQVDGVHTQFTAVLSDPLGRAELEVVGPDNHQAQPVSDLDGDGLPELVLFGQDSSVYTSQGSVWPLSDAVDWNYYPRVAAMDLDGQGELDLMVMLNGGFGISEIHPFLQGEDTLLPDEVITGIYATDAAVSVASGAEQEALLYMGDGVSRLGPEGLSTEIDTTDGWFYGVTTGDWDDDGALDLLVHDGQGAVLYASAPSGTLSVVPFTGPVEQLSNAVGVDVDGDGRQDLAGVRYDAEAETMVLESWLNLSGS